MSKIDFTPSKEWEEKRASVQILYSVVQSLDKQLSQIREKCEPGSGEIYQLVKELENKIHDVLEMLAAINWFCSACGKQDLFEKHLTRKELFNTVYYVCCESGLEVKKP